ATFICQGVSCIISLIFVFLRLKKIHIDGKAKVFSLRIFKDILLVAIPSILQQSSISVGNIIIQGVVNTFGTAVIAGYSAAVKLNGIAISSFVAISNGISNYSSQNYGAKNIERIKKGFLAGLSMFFVIAVPLILIYSIAGKYLINVFLSNPTDLASYTGKMFLLIVSPFYLVVSVKLISDGILRGTNQMGKFMIGTFADLIIRVVCAFILSKRLGANGIWSSWAIGWTISTVLSVLFYRFGSLFKKTNGNKNNGNDDGNADNGETAVSDCVSPPCEAANAPHGE
ncbi:MAG: MATE family efflux transporter, partial [Christensenellales bacterium]